MKVAILTSDDRVVSHRYTDPMPMIGQAPAALLQGFATLKDVETHVVCCVQQRVPSPVKLADNITCHLLHVSKLGWLRTSYQGCIRAVRQTLRKIAPDIVHGQGTERDCGISATFSGFPNVLTIHGNMRLMANLLKPRPFSYLWLTARLEAFTIPRSLGVICITDYTRRAVTALARRTWLLPNAVDASFFEIDADPKPGEKPVVLVVGHVDARKNQNAFIESLDSLAARREFRLVFLGRVADADAYGREFLRLVRARPWCSYDGFAHRDKLRSYFQGATALALPTLEDNCPLVILEAMAAGLPALASNVGGVPELIQSGENGLLCDPMDPGTFSTALEQLFDTPSLRRRLSVAGKATARERYHPSVIAKKHLEIYKDARRDAGLRPDA